MRVIFYAEPASLEESTRVKKVADKESLEARWVSLNELLELDQTPPGLRGDELLQWGNYLEKGGHVYPLSLISGESRQGPNPQQSASFQLEKISAHNTTKEEQEENKCNIS